MTFITNAKIINVDLSKIFRSFSPLCESAYLESNKLLAKIGVKRQELELKLKKKIKKKYTHVNPFHTA